MLGPVRQRPLPSTQTATSAVPPNSDSSELLFAVSLPFSFVIRCAVAAESSRPHCGPALFRAFLPPQRGPPTMPLGKQAAGQVIDLLKQCGVDGWPRSNAERVGDVAVAVVRGAATSQHFSASADRLPCCLLPVR